MAFPVVPVVLGAAAIGGIAWWLGGFSSGTATTASALGTTDGCARGTADAKAGKTAEQAAADANTDASITAAATKSGNFDAYAKAYADAHADCFSKNAPTITTDVNPITLPASPPPAKTPSTTAEWYLDRVNALSAWYTWSRKGAQEGYNEYVTDYEYRDFGTKTAKSAARSCGYAQGWALGKALKKTYDAVAKATKAAGGTPTPMPTHIALNAENSIFANCAIKFDAWYDAHKHDKTAGSGASVGGVVVGAVVGWMKKTNVGGRTLVGERVIFRLQSSSVAQKAAE